VTAMCFLTVLGTRKASEMVEVDGKSIEYTVIQRVLILTFLDQRDTTGWETIKPTAEGSALGMHCPSPVLSIAS